MKRKYVYLYLLGLLLFSVACTGNFRDYNTDLSGITDDDLIIDRKSTRLNSSHSGQSRMPSSA